MNNNELKKEEFLKLEKLIIWASEFGEQQCPWDFYCQRAESILGRILDRDERISLITMAVVYRHRDELIEHLINTIGPGTLKKPGQV
ncbi:MAG: hypothetical protein KF802_02675 [Bdellovibrionaceae bacterium]|nr:hypothetical protein [Pseudobdellovibrionaceae bacterium]